MAKDIQTIKSQFQVIQNETIESANTAIRVGGAGYDLAEYVGENRTGIIPHFNTEAELNASRPNPSNGEQAWVGTPYPGTVWNVVDGIWTDTTVVPDVNTVNLNSYLLTGGTTKTGAQLEKIIYANNSPVFIQGDINWEKDGNNINVYIKPNTAGNVLYVINSSGNGVYIKANNGSLQDSGYYKFVIPGEQCLYVDFETNQFIVSSDQHKYNSLLFANNNYGTIRSGWLVNNYTNVIGDTIGVKTPTKFFKYITGYYLAATQVGRTATKVAGSTLSYSEPLSVNKGDLVICKSQGTGIACICTTDANGTSYTAKAISDDGNNLKEYKYIVETDGYVAVSSRTSALNATLIKSNRIDFLERDVDRVVRTTSPIYLQSEVITRKNGTGLDIYFKPLLINNPIGYYIKSNGTAEYFYGNNGVIVDGYRVFTVPNERCLYLNFDTFELEVMGGGVYANGILFANVHYSNIVSGFLKNVININSKLDKGIDLFLSRQGEFSGYPENSLVSIQHAFEVGYNNIRVSVQYTSDNVAVLIHDLTINNQARNTDGSIIQDTINIRDITLSQANTYDWGIKNSPKYAGLNITTVESALIFCKRVGMKIRLELKAGNKDRFQELENLIYKYAMQDLVTICCTDYTQAALWDEVNKNITFAITYTPTAGLILEALKYVNGKREVWIDVWSNEQLTTEQLNTLRDAGIKVMSASVYNIGDMLTAIDRSFDLISVSGIEYPYDKMMKQYGYNISLPQGTPTQVGFIHLFISQSDYDLLTVKDQNTIYYVY